MKFETVRKNGIEGEIEAFENGIRNQKKRGENRFRNNKNKNRKSFKLYDFFEIVV